MINLDVHKIGVKVLIARKIKSTTWTLWKNWIPCM